MKEKSSKANLKKTAIWILVAAIIVGAGVLTFLVMRNRNNTQQSASATATPIAETSEASITVSSYKTYKLDTLDFAIVIATVHVESNAAINISLDHFKTDEGIQLDQVDEYRKAIQDEEILNGLSGTGEALESSAKTLDANLFIPIKDKEKTSLTVSCDITGCEDMTFDLNEAVTDSNAFSSGEQTVANEDGSLSLKITSSFEITGEILQQNGMDMALPSTARVFAYKVTVQAVPNDSTVLNAAVFNSNETGSINAESSAVYSEKYASLLGSPLQENEVGYLFFITLDQDHSMTSCTGTIDFTVDGQDSPLSVTTVMN